MRIFTFPKSLAISFFLSMLVAIVLLVAAHVSHAAMTIEICGGSNYTCKEPDKIGTPSWQGGSAVECDPVNADCQVKRNEITVNPKTPLATPSGWTAPVPPSVEPTPPSTSSNLVTSYPSAPPPNPGYCEVGVWDVGTPYYDAANNRAVGVYSNGPGTHPAPSGWSFQSTCVRPGASGSWAFFIIGGICPSGYTWNSGTGMCELSNANAVMKPTDGKCTIKRNGNSFSGDTRDPDCSSNPGVVVSGDTVTVSPKNGSSENVRYKFEPAGTGSITISKPNDDGTTTQRTIVFGSPDGTTGEVAITGTKVQTFSGTGDQASSSPVGELPTDYNRETTQQSILAELKKDRKIDETGTPTDSALSSAVTSFDNENATRLSSMEGVANVTELGLGLSITWPVSSCEDPSYEIPGTGKNLVVPMCAHRGDLQSITNWLVAILAALYIFTLGVGALRT